MDRCISCRNESADYSFPVIEVQTLHIRDLNGERKVQALGRDGVLVLCRDCAEAQLAHDTSLRGVFPRRFFGFLLVLAAGILIFAANRTVLGGDRVYTVFSLIAVLCGILGAAATSRSGIAERNRLLQLPAEEALRACAWKRVLACAPSKDGDNTLTYIPVDERTKAMKNGDLAVLFGLVPEIAIEAYRRIHEP